MTGSLTKVPIVQKPLTDVLVRGLAPPPSGRLEVTDTRCPGLEIRVTSGGAKSWSFRFRDPRTSALSRVTIGAYPDVSLSQARERAGQLRKTVAAGQNPNEMKRREREEATTKNFEALAERYLREYAYRFKRSAAADERNLRLHVLPKWGKRRYDEIQRRDVIALCEDMVASGRATQANRVQALISGVYSFALDADLVQANPCHRLKKRGVENIGRRILSDGELRIFWPKIVLPPVSRRVGLALRLVLLTGTRASEAAGATRAEFEHLDDLSRAAWVIPAERCKNGRPHYIPLSSLAVEVVRDALALVAPDEPCLFPSPSVEAAPITGHALAVAMARFSRGLRGDSEAVLSWKTSPPSPHDLRRSFTTRLSALGVPREDRDALLNHTPRDVGGQHYDLYDRAREKRVALETWAAALQGLLEDGPLADVVSLRERRQ
jgi:integrase